MNFSAIDKGLLKFCLEHSDYSGGGEGIPERDPQDYEWLKAALNSIEDDVTRMKKCVEVIKDGTSEQAIVRALEEIQYLSEDLDNANDLHKISGFSPILELLDREEPSIRTWSLWVIMTVSQNNPWGQDEALKKGSLAKVVSLLESEEDVDVLVKAVGAISALVKDHPEAQKELLQGEGFGRLCNLFDKLGENCGKLLFLMRWLFLTVPESRKMAIEHGVIEKIISCLSSEGCEVREFALMALSQFIRGGEECVKVCNSLHLDEQIKSRIEEKEIHTTERDLCEDLLSSL
eukprot:CAMPEP_0174262802 /NCGR_PEP_ID=MMETSP0439-20130205/15531_1 /TAXON_ID=0 /ORGANISM="Stereomyxa ramosa, Strain Chinc5" /LENGTH=289 /DNA_ID=CAMNT_0015347765 /DNA_START=30 /DNA_END=899 /DNA_ORIENTATION=+